MENFLIKNRKSFMFLFGNLFFLCLFLIFFNNVGLLLVNKYLELDLLFSLGVVSFFIWILLLTQKYNNYINKYFKLGFLIFAILCIVNSVYFLFIEYFNYSKVILISPKKFYYFFLITILFGFHFLYTKKNEIKKDLENTNKKNNNFNYILYGIIFLFIFIKIFFIFFYNGSYLDEYYHILGGQNFLKNFTIGKFYLNEDFYSRGLYVTFTESLFLYFSKTIFIAKLPMALIGILNFFIFFKICKFTVSKKNTLIAIFLYSTNPLIIFNHFYIRMFVFYETFFLLTLYILLKINKTRKKRYYVFLAVLNTFLVLNYLISGDVIVFIVGLSSIIGILILEWSKIKNALLKHFSLLILVVITAILFSFIKLTFVQDAIYSISDNFTVPQGAGSLGKFASLFIYNYSIITILFLLSIFSLFFSNNSNKKIIFIISCIIFFVHIFSPQPLQAVRSIFYFIPIFILVSVDSLNFFKRTPFLSYFLFFCLFIFNIGYPTNFFVKPFIPGEINYNEYREASDYIKENCSSSIKLFPIHHPEIFLFYDVDVNLTTFIKDDNDESFLKYYKNEDKYYTVFGNIETLRTSDELISNAIDKCVVISDEYRHSRRYLEESVFNRLGDFYKKMGIFSGIIVYHN